MIKNQPACLTALAKNTTPLYSYFMSYSLSDLFAELNTDPCRSIPQDTAIFTEGTSLFAATDSPVNRSLDTFQTDMAIIANLYSTEGVDFSLLPKTAGLLFELSADAFSALVHGWMSELPIKTEMLHFGRKVLAAGNRDAANRAACDRGDPNVKLVLDIQQKVNHEVHRFHGLLRFSPNEDGVYTALFAPDYLILPALGDYFTQRFGNTPWVIIDEKRSLCLSRLANKSPQLSTVNNTANSATPDPWEALWRHYHQTINNEGRSNPELQKQFMPKRHWKYLPEMGCQRQ